MSRDHYRSMIRGLASRAILGLSLLSGLAGPKVGYAQEAPAAEYPPFDKVIEGYTKVDSKSPDRGALCKLWLREKDGQVLMELPKDFLMKKYFIALTVSSGDKFAGLQAGDYYVYWRMYNKRLALILPELDIRSNGEPESKSSVKRLFTDTVL